MVFPVTILSGHDPRSTSSSSQLDIASLEVEEHLQRTNEQLRFLSSQLQETPRQLEELLEKHRHDLNCCVDAIDELRRENEKLREEIESKALRLQELERISATSNSELANNYDPRSVQTRAIAAEGEVASMRRDVRALTLSRTELQLTHESLEKTLARRETEGLDDTAAGVAQMQTLQKMIYDEEQRSETIRRQVLQSEDCSSMLITMQSKALHLSDMVTNYRTQIERLMQQYEQLIVECAEEAQRFHDEIGEAQREVDDAAVSCRKLEAELRAQVQSMHGALQRQKDKAQREKAMLKEMLHMTEEEVSDLLRDVESLMKERRQLEVENMKLSAFIENHPVNAEALQFLREDQQLSSTLTQHRSGHNRVKADGRRDRHTAGSSDDEAEIFIRTRDGRSPPVHPMSSSSSDGVGAHGLASIRDWEKTYLTRLQVRIGVLEKEEHHAATTKDATAAQLDHFSQHMAEEQRVREKELQILRSEVRALSFHEEVRIAKSENVQLRAILQERSTNEAVEVEDAEIHVASLQSTVAELQKRISDLTNSALEKERVQQQNLFQQQAIVAAARLSLSLAEDGARKAQSMQSKLESAELENLRLKECFKVEWGRRDHQPVVPPRISPPRTRPRPIHIETATKSSELQQQQQQGGSERGVDDFEEATPL